MFLHLYIYHPVIVTRKVARIYSVNLTVNTHSVRSNEDFVHFNVHDARGNHWALNREGDTMNRMPRCRGDTKRNMTVSVAKYVDVNIHLLMNGQGKVRPRTDNEAPEVE
jgi:hypothetical protein